MTTAVAMASDLAMALDPVLMMRSAGMEPDPWQVRFLRSRHRSKLLNNSRQSGKSTIVGVGVSHQTIYRPRNLTLLLAAGERQALELMRKVYAIYHSCKDAPRLVHDSMSELETSTGSRVIALPAKEGTVRSYSAVNLLVLDEASRVPDELYLSVLPMLAVSGGSVWALSTPFGDRGWWHAEVKSVKDHEHDGMIARAKGLPEGSDLPPWDYYEVPATQCPRIPAAFLEDMREKMGEWWFKQEFMCQFMSAQTQAFSKEDIDRAFSEEVSAWEL